MQYQINRVAIIGAGVMGASIAALIAGTGTPVVLLDILPRELSPEDLKKGLTMSDQVFRDKFAIAGKEKVLNPKNHAIYHKDFGDLITTGNIEDDLPLLQNCDWVLEVVLEELEVKQQLFKKINPFIGKQTIISSNTSGVSIQKIAEPFDDDFKKRFLGTHFFNPPRYMKLFEIIPNVETEQAIVKFMAEYATKFLGKGVVYAKDTPNFIANRIGAQANVAVMQLAEKYQYGISKVDMLCGEIIGRPKTATFKTIDMVGLDILIHVADNVMNNIASTYEEKVYHIPLYVRKLASLGHYGDKVGSGFYKKQKTAQGFTKSVWDYGTEAYIEDPKIDLDIMKIAKKGETLADKLNLAVWGDSEEQRFIWEVIKSNLLYSAYCIPEIADHVTEIDNGMKWGFNWQLGPFEIWDALGVTRTVERMQAEGENVPDWVLKRLNAGHKAFYEGIEATKSHIVLDHHSNQILKSNDDASLVDLGDGVACLVFKTKGNTVNHGVIEMIQQSVEIVENGDFRGLVIGNQSKNFSAGADLAMIGELAKEGAWKELETLIHDFQYANLKLKYCRKPVVSAPRGMTLGGGAEMALHAHRQVITAETYMGLVELGVGLIPGGGGCKELLAREMSNMEKAPLAERITHVKQIWKNIAMAKVSTSGYDAKKLGFVRSCDVFNMNADLQLTDAKNEVINLSQLAYTGNLKAPINMTGKTGFAAIKLELMQMVDGHFISEYDGKLAEKVAYILTGGNVLPNTLMDEETILGLEREVFLSLCGETKTQERIQYMLTKGKPLRN
ncbi:3-hydroxyacyl-CoA dehydrogenase/enoyl-CoA hydratase family protein [Fusibacter bizertensis]